MKKVYLLLIFCLVQIITQAQTIPSYVSTNGLVGYWPFNGNANDESGNGNHGTVNGATLTKDRFGNANSAYSFDGVDNFIEISSTTSLNTTNTTFTWSIWFKHNTISKAGRLLNPGLISKTENGTTCNGSTIFELNGYWGTQTQYCNSKVQNFDVGTPVMTANDIWHHLVCIVQAGSNSRFYIDGVAQSPSIVSSLFSIFPNTPIRLGKPTDGYWKAFLGQMDDFIVYNRVLTQQEITQLYNQTTPAAFLPTANILETTEHDCEAASKNYLLQNPDVARAGRNAWEHYNASGKSEGRKWPSCDILETTEHDCEAASKKYLLQNPDVARAGRNAWEHYNASGKSEGRKWPSCDVVGYWPFNGNANDESGNGNHGTVNGATLTTDRFGNANSAYSFDGVNDYIDFGDVDAFDFSSSNFTISIWVNRLQLMNTSNYDNTAMFGKWDHGASTPGQNEFHIGFNHVPMPINTVGFYIENGSNMQGVLSNTTVLNNVWTNIIVKRNIDSIYVYINGILQQSSYIGNIAINNIGRTLLLGALYPNNPDHISPWNFNNAIFDDIVIYNRALNQKEITSIYTPSPPPCTFTTNIFAQDSIATCGSSYILNAGAGYSNYKWNTGATTQSITVNNSGWYACTVSNSKGCVASASIYIAVNPLPTITATSTTVCRGNSVSLIASDNNNALQIENKVAQFSNNASNVIGISYNSQSIPTNNFSYEFWFNTTRTISLLSEKTGGKCYDALNGQNFVVFPYFSNTPYYRGTGISVGTNGISVIEHCGDFFDARLTYASALTGWHHCAVVYQNNGLSLYLDGNLISSRSNGSNFGGLGTQYNNVGLLQNIGNGYPGNDNDPNDNYTGKLDEYRQWSVALTASQISQIYKRKLQTMNMAECNLNLTFDQTTVVNNSNVSTGLSVLNTSLPTFTSDNTFQIGGFTGTTINSIISNNFLEVSSSNYLWSTGANTKSINVTPTKTTTYWCDVTRNGVTCRKNITITVVSITAPTGSATQTHCSGSTVANLTATGSNIKWYATAKGKTPLAWTTPLVNGKTYYASQMIDGKIESTSRLAVTVTINEPQITASSTNVCIGTPVSLGISNTTSSLEQFQSTHADLTLFHTIGSHAYFYKNQAVKWSQAKAYGDQIGVSLYVINDAAEDLSVYNSLPFRGNDGKHYWIGLFQDLTSPNYSEPAGSWKWVDNTPLQYTNWYSGEPNNAFSSGENFAQIEWENTGIKWNDAGNTSNINNCACDVSYPIYEFQNQTKYLWSTGATTASISLTPTATTTYWCDVNTNGVTCRKNITIKVISNTAPRYNSTKTITEINSLQKGNAKSSALKVKIEAVEKNNSKGTPFFKPIVSADGKKKVSGSIYSIKGYRIVIYNGADKNAALTAKNNFSKAYPSIRSYLSYNVPSYKIKIGDFADKNAATKLLRQLIIAFPASFIVPDLVTVKNINITE